MEPKNFLEISRLQVNPQSSRILLNNKEGKQLSNLAIPNISLS